MNKVIRKAFCKYENQLVIGYFNIDIKVLTNSDKDKLETFWDLYRFKNIFHSEIDNSFKFHKKH